MKSLFICNRDFELIPRLQEKYSGLKTIWYDGQSDIIRGLIDLFQPETLLIEDTVELAVKRTNAPLSSTRVIIQQCRTPDQSSELDGEVWFYPTNDTHTYLFHKIPAYLSNTKFVVSASQRKRERVREALVELNIPFEQMDSNRLNFNHCLGFVVGNDWGPYEQIELLKFQRKQIPTYCLQESVINFNDQQHRMEWCTFPLIQGIITTKSLHRDILFLTGNPRYETLLPSKMPENKIVLINCNFTYGVFEDVRSQWIADIVDVCNNNKLAYLISQHPRDRGDLSKYNVVPSNASLIHSQLSNSSLLITRFSSLIYEALALGRPVVYYNPHNEKMDYDFEPDGEHMVVAKSKAELQQAISNIKEKLDDLHSDKQYYRNYSMRHHGSSDGNASKRIAQVISLLSQANITQTTMQQSRVRLGLRYFKVWGKSLVSE